MTSERDIIASYLEHAVQSGDELGIQCAVWKEGAQLVDCAFGYADIARTRPVTRETLFPVFSTGKAILSALALRMVADGRMVLDAPLCRYWPEFTGSGKENATVAHVLTHTTGLFCMPHADTPEELADWELMCTRLATMRPAWAPGTRTKYQALNYSWLLGEPICRLTGLPLRQAMLQELLQPLNLQDGIVFGMDAASEARAAELFRTPELLPPLPPKPTFLNPTENLLRETVIRQVALPAFNGYAAASALCRFGAALLDAAQPYLPKDVLMAAATSHRPDPLPEKAGYWERFGYGFLLYDAPTPGLHLFGHGGYGGAELLICPERRTVCAVTRNRLADTRGIHTLLRELFF